MCSTKSTYGTRTFRGIIISVQASPSILHPLQIKHSVAAGLSEQGLADKLKRTMETVCNKMAIEKFLSIQVDFFQIFLFFLVVQILCFLCRNWKFCGMPRRTVTETSSAVASQIGMYSTMRLEHSGLIRVHYKLACTVQCDYNASYLTYVAMTLLSSPVTMVESWSNAPLAGVICPRPQARRRTRSRQQRVRRHSSALLRTCV